MKILDSHAHWFPKELAKKTTFFKVGWSDLDSFLSIMDKEKIEKSVLLYPTSDAHINLGSWDKLCSLYNEAIAKVVKLYPDRLIGAAILPADDPKKLLLEFRRACDLGLQALSLASSYEGKFLDDEMFYPVYEEAQKKNIIIFVHSQVINPIGFDRVKDPLLKPVLEYVFDVSMCTGKLMMSKTFNKFPDLKFVFAHFAGVIPFVQDRFDRVYTMLRSRNIVEDLGKLPTEILKNIYVDTSGVTKKSIIEFSLDFFGSKQVLWGSDYPAKKEVGETINSIKELNIDDKNKELILAGNLERILGESK
ncbi:MAG: amidohydrolase family protein [Candidatus Omnitrophota bacterium]